VRRKRLVAPKERTANVANTLLVAAASTDDFDDVPALHEPKEDAKPPAHSNNNKSMKKKSVRISIVRLEQPFDNGAPAADALQDYPIVNSVQGKRPAYQCT